MFQQTNQGFSSFGGAPYNNTPALMNIDIGARMQQHLGTITSYLCSDMQSRGTPVANHMYQQYSQNAFNNAMLGNAITTAANYMDYVMCMERMDFNNALRQTIPFVNDVVLCMLANESPQAASHIDQHEGQRLTASWGYYNNIKNNIKQFIAQNNQPAFGNNGFGGFGSQPTGASTPQDRIREMMNRRNPGPAFGGGNFNNTGFNSYNNNDAVSNYNRMMGAHANFGSNTNNMGNMGFGGNQYNNNSAPVNSQGFNSYTMNQSPNNQPPVMNSYASNNSYNHSPAVNSYGAPVNNQPSGDTTLLSAEEINRRAQQLRDSVARNTYNHNAVVSNQQTVSKYEEHVRNEAKNLGLPWDSASLDFLEDAILKIDPHCTFIDKKSAYNGMQGKVIQDTQPVRSFAEIINASREDVKVIPESEFDKMRNEFASKSDKVMIDLGGGICRMVKPEIADKVNEARASNPNIRYMEVLDIVNEVTPPYPFAKRRASDGAWYFSAKHLRDITNEKRTFVFLAPVVCDPYTLDGWYICDDDGYLINFFSTKKENPIVKDKESNVDYNLHDNTKLLQPFTKRDAEAEADFEKTVKAFADAQHAIKVEEVVQAIEDASNDANETTFPYEVNETVQLDGFIAGERVGDDYVYAAEGELHLQLDGKSVNLNNATISYTHLTPSRAILTGKSNDVAISMRHKPDLDAIYEILEKASEENEMPESQITIINGEITSFLNNLMNRRLGLKTTIDSFMLDWADLKDFLESKNVYDEVKRYAKHFINTVLFVADPGQAVFETIIGENEYKKEEASTFCLLRDVTVLPIFAKDITLRSDSNQNSITVHRDTHPELFFAIKQRHRVANVRAYEILFVTKDNRVLYAEATSNSEIYKLYTTSLIG